jgi:hypothetical protein
MFICEAAIGLKPVWKLLNTHGLPKNGDSFWPKRVLKLDRKQLYLGTKR